MTTNTINTTNTTSSLEPLEPLEPFEEYSQDHDIFGDDMNFEEVSSLISHTSGFGEGIDILDMSIEAIRQERKAKEIDTYKKIDEDFKKEVPSPTICINSFPKITRPNEYPHFTYQNKLTPIEALSFVNFNPMQGKDISHNLKLVHGGHLEHDKFRFENQPGNVFSIHPLRFYILNYDTVKWYKKLQPNLPRRFPGLDVVTDIARRGRSCLTRWLCNLFGEFFKYRDRLNKWRQAGPGKNWEKPSKENKKYENIFYRLKILSLNEGKPNEITKFFLNKHIIHRINFNEWWLENKCRLLKERRVRGGGNSLSCLKRKREIEKKREGKKRKVNERYKKIQDSVALGKGNAPKNGFKVVKKFIEDINKTRKENMDYLFSLDSKKINIITNYGLWNYKESESTKRSEKELNDQIDKDYFDKVGKNYIPINRSLTIGLHIPVHDEERKLEYKVSPHRNEHFPSWFNLLISVSSIKKDTAVNEYKNVLDDNILDSLLDFLKNNIKIFFKKFCKDEETGREGFKPAKYLSKEQHDFLSIYIMHGDFDFLEVIMETLLGIEDENIISRIFDSISNLLRIESTRVNKYRFETFLKQLLKTEDKRFMKLSKIFKINFDHRESNLPRAVHFFSLNNFEEILIDRFGRDGFNISKDCVRNLVRRHSIEFLFKHECERIVKFLLLKRKLGNQSNYFKILRHQVIGVSYIIDRNNTLLADDMGLGKTMQAILSSFIDKSISNTLIICPKPLINHWRSELKKWSIQCGIKIEIDVNFLKHEGNKSKSKKYVIVSHTYALRNFEVFKKKDIIDLAICDEVHLYSTGKTWTPNLIKILSGIKKIILLSGTPIRHNLDEMDNLLKILKYNPEDECFVTSDRYLFNYYSSFRRKIFTQHTLRRTKKFLNNSSSSFELPKMEIKTVNVSLDLRSRSTYNNIKVILSSSSELKLSAMAIHSILRRLCVCFDSLKPEIRNILRDTDGKNLKENKERCEHLLKRLKNIKSNEECSICFEDLDDTDSTVLCVKTCGHAFCKTCIEEWKKSKNNCPLCRCKIGENGLMPLNDFINKTDSKKKKLENTLVLKENEIVPKFLEVKNICEQNRNDQIIVFSDYVLPLRKLKEYLDECKITSRLVVGGDNSGEHYIKEFKTDRSIQVLLATKKCSVGLNFVNANKVIFLSVPVSVNIDKQSRDRVYRIGQKKPVDIYYLITENSLEVDMYKRLRKKEELIDKFYDGNVNISKKDLEKALSSLRLEDCNFLQTSSM
jgi:SNF2 family DNA or RNA helicase